MKRDPPDDPDRPAERRLRELGYAVDWRQAGWHECLVSGHGECWHGQGPSPAAALAHALLQMLPSHAARRGFESSLAATQTEVAAPEPAAAAADAAAAAALVAEPGRNAGEPAAGPAAEPADEPAAEPASEPVEESVGRVRTAAAAAAVPGPPVADEPAAAEEPVLARLADAAPAAEEAAREKPAEPTPEASAPAAAAEPTVLVPRPGPRQPVPRRPLPEILAGLDAIDEAIAAAQEEAGLLVPERQRLLLLSWIAAARALEGQSGGAHEAFARTRLLAQRCSRLARIWWPGTVRAMAMDATPHACSDELVVERPRLSCWADVVDAAEASLAALEDDPHGDEHGWSDGGALEPRHHRPDVLLHEVVLVLEKATGPVVRVSDDRDCNPRLPGERQLLRAELAPWLLAANRLRWLRGAVLDLELWAAAIGRLRWLATKLPRVQAEPLARALDPAVCPQLGWARELGYDPDRRRRQRERKQLLTAPPEPDWTDAQLRDWLLRALDLGEEMPKERVASLVAGLEDRVLAIAPAGFSERRNQRVRLDAVQRLLRQQQQPAVLVPAPGAPDDDDDDGPSPEMRLLAVLQGFTRGRSALFVTNRNDSANAAQVRELLQFDSVDLCESKSAALAAKAKSIEQERYDFVLAATGFLSHTADHVLKAAAKRAGIPYISVNRGRPLSCVRALARELGVAIPAA